MDQLQEKLKNWNFPLCTLGEDHSDNQLNKICIDSRCGKKAETFSPLCVICEEFNVHNQQAHLTKPLKLILKDILRNCHDPTASLINEDPIVNQLGKISKEFRQMSSVCLKLSQDILQSLDTYKFIICQESSTKRQCKGIIEKVLNSQDAQNLKDSLKELRSAVNIENDIVKINEDVTQSIKKTMKSNAEKYHHIMSDSIKRLESMLQQLVEISVIQGVDYDREINILNGADSTIKQSNKTQQQ